MADSRIVSWNINSIRSRLGRALAWCDEHQPDVVCFQETKCDGGAFPVKDFAALGYESCHHGAPGGYNGVAIVSRVGLDDVELGFPGTQPAPFNEPRLIAATCAGIRVFNVYGPHGRDLNDRHYQFKLLFYERLRQHLLDEIDATDAALVLGDFNVAPTALDVYNPKARKGRTHTSQPEREALSGVVDVGLMDMLRHFRPDEPGVFTYWSYKSKLASNHGMRIDHHFASTAVAEMAVNCWVDIAERMEDGASDHAPVVLDLRM